MRCTLWSVAVVGTWSSSRRSRSWLNPDAEPDAPPNGGPAGPFGNSGVADGPPSEALMLAESSGVDLVELEPLAKPPVCRLVDFGLFRYEQAKRRKRQK
ncbi:MAG: hypothetical protein ACLQM8_01090 [Limisphaerales bacterium]